MTRVIHTGDTHVGYRQYNSPDRRADFLAAFQQVLDDAVAGAADGEVDAVVHAGDLFHDRRPDLQDLLGVLEGLTRLREAGVPFLAVVGNHESTRGHQWLDLFSELGLATRLGAAPTVVGDVAFYGLDFVPRSQRDALTYEFAPPPSEATAAALVAHGQFAPLAPAVHGDAWDLETVLESATVPFDAVLLGDEHTPDTQRLSVDGRTVPATYCGSTERASAAERAGRGYNLVAFDERGVDVRRRSIATREFVYVTVELADGEGVDRAREQVRQHDLADAVVIVELVGAGEPVTPASVEEAALADGALIARVTDRRDVDEEADGDRSVSFADPDEAVRERVAEMGLSAAARDVDAVVREGTVADSNVRDRTTERVRELLDAGELDAFAPADATADDEGDQGDEAETDPHEATADDGGAGTAAGGDAGSADDGAAPAGATSDGDVPPVASAEATTAPGRDRQERRSPDAAVESDGAGTEDGDDDEATDGRGDGHGDADGQATLAELGGSDGGDDTGGDGSGGENA
jgi:DNA repair exonuclease SbcCD nuclease subunit